MKESKMDGVRQGQGKSEVEGKGRAKRQKEEDTVFSHR